MIFEELNLRETILSDEYSITSLNFFIILPYEDILSENYITFRCKAQYFDYFSRNHGASEIETQNYIIFFARRLLHNIELHTIRRQNMFCQSQSLPLGFRLSAL